MIIETFTQVNPDIFYKILLSCDKTQWARNFGGTTGKKGVSAFIYDVISGMPMPTQDLIKQRIVDKIIELFPGRVKTPQAPDGHGRYIYLYNALADFNSHPDTIYEDIELVLERLAFPGG